VGLGSAVLFDDAIADVLSNSSSTRNSHRSSLVYSQAFERAIATRKNAIVDFNALRDLAPIPPHLSCPICQRLLRDASSIPCCGASFCDDCIRTRLTAEDTFGMCPTPGCGEEGMSADRLVPNRSVRQAVEEHLREFVRVKEEGGTMQGERTAEEVEIARLAAIQAQAAKVAPVLVAPVAVVSVQEEVVIQNEEKEKDKRERRRSRTRSKDRERDRERKDKDRRRDKDRDRSKERRSSKESRSKDKDKDKDKDRERRRRSDKEKDKDRRSRSRSRNRSRSPRNRSRSPRNRSQEAAPPEGPYPPYGPAGMWPGRPGPAHGFYPPPQWGGPRYPYPPPGYPPRPYGRPMWGPPPPGYYGRPPPGPYYGRPPPPGYGQEYYPPGPPGPQGGWEQQQGEWGGPPEQYGAPPPQQQQPSPQGYPAQAQAQQQQQQQPGYPAQVIPTEPDGAVAFDPETGQPQLRPLDPTWGQIIPGYTTYEDRLAQRQAKKRQREQALDTGMEFSRQARYME